MRIIVKYMFACEEGVYWPRQLAQEHCQQTRLCRHLGMGPLVLMKRLKSLLLDGFRFVGDRHAIEVECDSQFLFIGQIEITRRHHLS